MATTITQALLARFVASGVDDFSAAGGLWLEEAPPNLPLPVIGFAHSGESCDYTTERDYLESGSFEFSIYALGVAETERLGLIVKDVFDPCIKSPRLLDFTGGKVTEFERTNGQTGVEGIRQEDNKQVGRVTFTYRYTVERLLPA